mgnify:CR=1 FL=1
MNFNTIFLDAFYEGKLLCGDQVVLNKLRSLVLNVTKGFIKTKDGWVRAVISGRSSYENYQLNLWK